ncbi:hypothetical protein ACNGFG_08640 [Campylobacter coli]
MSEWLDADYKQTAKEEKKVQHLKEKYQMKKCINEYLINRYKDSKIATLIEFNVRAKASEKINTLQDFVTSLIYLTPNEYKEIEEKVIGELQKEAIKNRLTTRAKENQSK